MSGTKLLNKFNVGDEIWYATSGTRETKVLCSECFGKRVLKVTLGDDSEVLIPCENCSYRPYEGAWESVPHGYCRYWEWYAKPEKVTINRVEISNEKVEYGFNGNYRMEEDRAFLTEEEAKIKADQLAVEHNNQELARIHEKEKHNRTWAWNLSYHRKRIKEAQRDLEYHTAKANAAKLYAKQDKETK